MCKLSSFPFFHLCCRGDNEWLSTHTVLLNQNRHVKGINNLFLSMTSEIFTPLRRQYLIRNAMKSLTLLFKTNSLPMMIIAPQPQFTQNSNPMSAIFLLCIHGVYTVIFHTHLQINQSAEDWWNKGTKHRKTYLYSVVPAVAFRLTGTPFPNREAERREKRWQDRTGQERRGGGKWWGKFFFFFFGLTTSYTPRRRWRVQLCERLIKAERKRLCSPVILCRLPGCVMWLGERVLFIQVSWGNRCLILMPHLSWPLSLTYRSPSPSHWCIFISVVTWLFKGSLA